MILVALDVADRRWTSPNPCQTSEKQPALEVLAALRHGFIDEFVRKLLVHSCMLRCVAKVKKRKKKKSAKNKKTEVVDLSRTAGHMHRDFESKLLHPPAHDSQTGSGRHPSSARLRPVAAGLQCHPALVDRETDGER